MAKEKMKKQVKTIITLPALCEEGWSFPCGHNLVTPTVANMTKQIAIEADPHNKHFRRPNLSTMYSATNVEAKLTAPRTMEVSKESCIPTALKMVVP